LYSPVNCFLDPEHFVVMDSQAPPIEVLLRAQIARSREPFVLGAFESYARGQGRAWHGSPTRMTEDERLAAMRSLPIWAVVDGWTIGLLGRVITETKPVDVDGQPRWLWKRVAADFSVSNSVFQTQLSSLVVLRNLV